MRTEIRYIAEDGTPFENQADCREYENQLAAEKENERKREIKRLSDAFLTGVGFDITAFNTERELNTELSRTWLIFDKYGDVKGLKTCGGGQLVRGGVTYDFRYISGDDKKDPEIMENWLRKQKYYGHNLSSFAERNESFYALDLLGKLKNLGWDVEDGRLVHNQW